MTISPGKGWGVVAKMKVAIAGCGNIMPAYVRGCRMWEALELVACSDAIPEKAEAAAREHGIPRAIPAAALNTDPGIDIVINLTPPGAHAEVTLAAIAGGKHVQSEKPLAITREDGAAILRAAAEQGVRIGCAPDTILGGGLQTARKLLDEGAIGTPVGATAFMLRHGPEDWHPNPDFFYQRGAGPIFDMGPYYLTALVMLLGPVRRATASTRITFPERIITNPRQRTGEKIPVQVPTHAAAVLDFAAGPVVTVILSFDVWASTLPHIEIFGSEGTMVVPDPNTFGGPVMVRRFDEEVWTEAPIPFSQELWRGIGAADMAHAIQSGRPHRTSGELAYHVLDLMHTLEEASSSGRHILLESTCARPAPLPVGLPAGLLDD